MCASMDSGGRGGGRRSGGGFSDFFLSVGLRRLCMDLYKGGLYVGVIKSTYARDCSCGKT